MSESSIEITIKPVYLKHDYVYIPVKHTKFFPSGKPQSIKSIQVETDADVIDAQLQYNSKAYI